MRIESEEPMTAPTMSDLGPLPAVPKVERRIVGLAHHPTEWEVWGPVVATMPDGCVVELPVGTVLMVRQEKGADDGDARVNE